jgi:hypothetical protein
MPCYKRGLKERCKIERKFGEAKQGHGLNWYCCYLGGVKYAIQAYLTALVLMDGQPANLGGIQGLDCCCNLTQGDLWLWMEKRC